MMTRASREAARGPEPLLAELRVREFSHFTVQEDFFTTRRSPSLRTNRFTPRVFPRANIPFLSEHARKVSARRSGEGGEGREVLELFFREANTDASILEILHARGVIWIELGT